jgi:hypothetical protein
VELESHDWVDVLEFIDIAKGVWAKPGELFRSAVALRGLLGG